MDMGRLKAFVGLLAVLGALAFYANTQINPSGAYFVQQYDKEIFISEKGNDANTGTADKPVRSFRKALSSVPVDSSARVIVQDREYRFAAIDQGTDYRTALVIPPGSTVLITNPHYVVSTRRLDGVPVVTDAKKLPQTFSPGTKLLGVNGNPTQVTITSLGTLALAGFEFVSVNLKLTASGTIDGGIGQWYYGKYDVFGNVFGAANKPFPGMGRHVLELYGQPKLSLFRYNIVHVEPATRDQELAGGSYNSLRMTYGGWYGASGRVEYNLFQYLTDPREGRVGASGIIWRYPKYDYWDHVRAQHNSFVSPGGQVPQGAAAAGGWTPEPTVRYSGIRLVPDEPGCPGPDPLDQERADIMERENDFSLFTGTPVSIGYYHNPDCD